jgi:class 3 adenylate cyclase
VRIRRRWNWSDLGVSGLLPTGTVTMLLADVEGSTRLWEANQTRWRPLVALLDRTVPEAVAAHGGVRPVEQGEGDSFVAAFARAGDAVACAFAATAGTAGADPVADRGAPRRHPAARRRQLRRSDNQSDGTAARPRGRRTDRTVGCDKRSGYRSTAGRCLVDRSEHTSSAPSAA